MARMWESRLKSPWHLNVTKELSKLSSVYITWVMCDSQWCFLESQIPVGAGRGQSKSLMIIKKYLWRTAVIQGRSITLLTEMCCLYRYLMLNLQGQRFKQVRWQRRTKRSTYLHAYVCFNKLRERENTAKKLLELLGQYCDVNSSETNEKSYMDTKYFLQCVKLVAVILNWKEAVT